MNAIVRDTLASCIYVCLYPYSFSNINIINTHYQQVELGKNYISIVYLSILYILGYVPLTL
jgi:hypothetical protein